MEKYILANAELSIFALISSALITRTFTLSSDTTEKQRAKSKDKYNEEQSCLMEQSHVVEHSKEIERSSEKECISGKDDNSGKKML